MGCRTAVASRCSPHRLRRRVRRRRLLHRQPLPPPPVEGPAPRRAPHSRWAGARPPVQLPTPTPAPTGQPMITAVSPSVAAPGSVVALQGSGFGTRGWVRFGRRLLPVVSWSDTSISVQLPPYTHARAYLVVIRSDG